jgi:hypothetical protein
MGALRHLALLCAMTFAGLHAARAENDLAVTKPEGLGQPFALHVADSHDVRPPGITVTLRSLVSDSGCLTAKDCSAMLFRGSLVLSLGQRREFHAVDAMILRDAPYRFDFAGFSVLIDSVQPDASGRLAATFTLVEPESPDEAPQNDVAGAPQASAQDAQKDVAGAPARPVQIGIAVDHAEEKMIQATHIAVRIQDQDSHVEPIPIWIEPKQSSLSNAGWTLFLHSTESLTKLEVMTPDLPDWVRTEGADREFYAGLGFFDEQTTVEVRGFSADGKVLGPYKLKFDALAALREDDARTLRSMPGVWVQYDDKYAYFGRMFSSHCGLREVRYSIDSKALDKRLALTPCSISQHGRMPPDTGDVLRLESTPRYIAMQLVYYDGTESPVSVVREGLH